MQAYGQVINHTVGQIYCFVTRLGSLYLSSDVKELNCWGIRHVHILAHAWNVHIKGTVRTTIVEEDKYQYYIFFKPYTILTKYLINDSITTDGI